MHAFLQPQTVARADVRRRVLIVDDHNFFAACLRTLLDNESDLVVCDIMANSCALNERIERLQPDLLVIDLSLGSENGFEVGEQLRSLGILTPILFISSMSVPEQEKLSAIANSAFIGKSRSPSDFLTALRGILIPSETRIATTAGLAFSQ
jgi:DNA-binding NarL/FixJ family response regulator